MKDTRNQDDPRLDPAVRRVVPHSLTSWEVGSGSSPEVAGQVGREKKEMCGNRI